MLFQTSGPQKGASVNAAVLQFALVQGESQQALAAISSQLYNTTLGQVLFTVAGCAHQESMPGESLIAHVV